MSRRTHATTLLAVALLATACEPTYTLAFCALPVDDAPQRGSEAATVTLVEFSDFECPYCGSATATIATLLANHAGQLRQVYRHLPLPQHASARPAAIAAICAQEQGRFWEMHDLLFENQNALEEQDLVAYAAEVGLDVESWDACRSSDAARARLDTDADAAREAGVTATPTFFVNGEPLIGAQPLGDFEAAVDRALEDAAASGLAPAAYYESLVELGCE